MRRTVGEIAVHIQGRVEGEAEKDILGVAPLATAGPDELSYLAGAKYKAAFEDTRAGAVIVPEDFETDRPVTLIRVSEPNLAFAQAAWLFVPPEEHPKKVLPGAVVEPDASVGEGASVYPLSYVGAKAEVGPDAVIYPLAYVGPEVKVGPRTVVHPHAVLMRGVRVGADCIIHPGAVIGADGFGFTPQPDGSHLKIPQTGTVEIGDGVEVGANTTIDRATFGPTSIAKGVKIDNLVQVAHNCSIGANSLLAAMVGLSGSCSLGEGCVLAGQVGLADHINLGDRVSVGAGSGVMRDVEAGERIVGYPAWPRGQAARVYQRLGELPDLVRMVQKLEKRLVELEEKLGGGEEE